MSKVDIEALACTLVEIGALLEFASEAPWRGAKAPDVTSRKDMVDMLREQWLCGPDSVDNEFFHILADEGAEEVSVCVVGNGPKRRDNTVAIVGLRNAWPIILRGVNALLREREKTEAGLRDLTKFLAAMQLNGDAARVVRENGLWRDEEPSVAVSQEDDGS